jgi:hypothetical protein
MAFNEEKHRRMELRKATGTRVIKPPQVLPKGADYAMSFACLNCRTSNKRHFDGYPCDYPKTMLCPVCKGESFNLGRNFKPPRKNDLSQWKKVELLVAHGFLFQKIRLDKDSYDSVPYPKTLAEAKVFVVKYKEYSWK